MKITITGSLGNTGRPLTEILIKAGHQVTVISSNPDKAKEIEAMGATAAIGSVQDVDFLTRSFSGADALYTMVPPDLSTTSYKGYIAATGKVYAAAIKAAGVKRVVNLSSIGAHLPDGTGPIAGLHQAEQSLNQLPDVAVKHLRAGFFYTNFYTNTDMIRHAGIMGNNFGAESIMMMVHPTDIAAAAAEELQKDFSGKSVRYVISDERTAGEAAAAIGKAIGKPELPWVAFTDEQSMAGMLQAGLSEDAAANFIEMGSAVRNGSLWGHYLEHKEPLSGVVRLEQFAADFARAYNS